jgi:hypothetical protein
LPPRPPVLEPDRHQSFRPTLHRRSHHPVSPPSPPPRRFPGFPSTVFAATGDGSCGCSSRVGGEAQDQRGNGEEGHMVSVRMLGWRERRLFHGGGVGRGRGGHGGCSVLFSHASRASTPSPVQAAPTTVLPSPARESALQHPFSSFDAPTECRPRQGSHRSIAVSSSPSTVSHQCHLLPRHVPVQPPSLLFTEIPLLSPVPLRPSHTELAHELLRSRCRRLQQRESSHGLRRISGRPSRRTRRQRWRKGTDGYRRWEGSDGDRW